MAPQAGHSLNPVYNFLDISTNTPILAASVSPAPSLKLFLACSKETFGSFECRAVKLLQFIACRLNLSISMRRTTFSPLSRFRCLDTSCKASNYFSTKPRHILVCAVFESSYALCRYLDTVEGYGLLSWLNSLDWQSFKSMVGVRMMTLQR